MASERKRIRAAAPVRREKAELTVFFALILPLILSLILAAAETVRVQCARLYYTQALNSAVDSLFSQYHADLWKEYRLLGLEHYSTQQLFDETGKFLRPYLEAKNYYPMEPDPESPFRLVDSELLVAREGAAFEEEVLDYMKYGALVSVWDLTAVSGFLDFLKEGSAVGEVSGLYDRNARAAVRVEAAIEAIRTNVEEASAKAEAAVDAAIDHDLPRLEKNIRQIIRRHEVLPDLIDRYEKQADRFMEKLEISRRELEEQYASGAMTPETYASLGEEITEYETYISKDGDRRREITSFRERASANIAYLQQVLEEAYEAEETVAEHDPDDEDDDFDEDEVWLPVISDMENYDRLHLNGAAGVGDKEKEGFLENIRDLMDGDLIDLLLPEGTEVSPAEREIPSAPSALFIPDAESALGLSDRIFMAEYTARFLNYYGRGTLYKDTRYEGVKKGSGALEAEYALTDEDSDREALRSFADRLIKMRTGLNLLYLFRDAGKREAARNLALVITGALGFTPLVAVMHFMILGVWAFGQALVDVKTLLAGRGVPFMHTASSFRLTPEGLLEIGRTGSISTDSEDDGGLYYPDYLKIFLIAEHGSEQEFRVMDMIQFALSKKQTDFRLDRCLRSLTLSGTVRAEHVFTGILSGPAFGSYPITAESSFRY